ncbi:MAG: asparagine synthase-related protein [Pseudomonadota bacterium]|nr:asparagine synthase-related protein [Pseudomonadota bacterium]
MGDLFPSGPAPLDERLKSVATEQLLRSRAPENVWGRYVALADAGDELRIYCDPSGAVAAYCRPDSDFPLIFSDPHSVRAAGLIRPQVDWHGLSHRLFYPQLQCRRTGWHGVFECLPGQQMVVGRSLPDTSLWTPWRHVTPLETQPSVLRDRLQSVVAALTAQGRSILLELSGGLDSSILAGCLATSRAKWSGSNLFTPARDGDERHHAREVAAYWNASLIEAALEPDSIDLLAPPRLSRVIPGGLGMIAAVDSLHERACSQTGAEALMSGTGGDNVFCSLRSAAPVVDAWRAHGFASAYAAARDLADLTGSSIWAAARAARRYDQRDRKLPQRWPGSPDLLASEARPSFDAHPWLNAPTDRLPGKRAHIILLLRAHSVVQAIDRARRNEMIFPLLSQPVVETCLGVSSWRWIAKGRDGAFAREAFRELLPAGVRARRVKGRLESWLNPPFLRQRQQIRELLMEGRLARHGLVDRLAIEQATSPGASADDRLFATLMRFVDAELWLSDLG